MEKTRIGRHVSTTALIVSLCLAINAAAQHPSKTWLQYASPEEAGHSSDSLKSILDLYRANGASALLIVYDGNVLLSEGDITRRYDTHSMRKSLASALYGIYKGNGRSDIHKTLKEIGIVDGNYV
jgi:hypothetical protein